jgi:PmbA protein
LLSAISGGNLYREQSFLLDHLGKPIFPDWMQITEDPYIKRGLASSLYDGEGVAVHQRELISKGVLQGYLLSTYSGKRLGMPTTGNSGGPHNVIVQSTGQSFDELLDMLGTGLLVMDVIGQGVNLMTGDYSRGASGFWVENGSIQYPVEELTIASNLKQMYQGIQAVGIDRETRGGVQVGSILIDEMMIAGE